MTTSRQKSPYHWADRWAGNQATVRERSPTFRLTYPFSTAFMDTLVHVSSALRRNRTGTTLMGQLLADHDLNPQEDVLWRIVIDLPYDEGGFGPVEPTGRQVEGVLDGRLGSPGHLLTHEFARGRSP